MRRKKLLADVLLRKKSESEFRVAHTMRLTWSALDLI
jgi:hypothetical protein